MTLAVTNHNLNSTSLNYVLTQSGFEQIEDVIRNNIPVYCVDTSGNTELVQVSRWTFSRGNTYKISNRDSNTISYCNEWSLIYMSSDSDLEGGLFPLNPASLNDSYRPRLFTHINIKSTNKTLSERNINDIVRTRTLNSECVESSVSTIYQILDKWKATHGRYSVINYNQGLLFQAMLAKVGYCSNIVNNHGLTVEVTSTNKTVEITDTEITHEVNLNRIPYDKDNHILHLIYSCNGSSFIG